MIHTRFLKEVYINHNNNPSAQLVDTVLGTGMKAIGNYAVFIKPDPWNHQQLWVTDGTKGGTKLLKDIDVNGPPSALLNTRFNNPFTAWGSKLLFNAEDGTHRKQLWATDGTDTGTHILINAVPGASSLSPTYMTICNGKIFFAGTNDNGETSLWVSDGTNAGTKSISSPMGLSENRMASFAAFNNKIYFNDFNSLGIWESDGTASGTHLFADSIGYQGKYMITNGYLYFFGREISGTYLYRIDSQSNLAKASTPLQSKIIDPDYEMGTLNNKLIFCGAPAGSNDYELWSVDDFPADVKNIGYKNEKIIYPNPATNAFSIQSANNTNAVIKVFSLTGT